MLFLLVLFLCGSIILFSLLHTNTASVESLLLPAARPDEQITTWAGHGPGGRLCLSSCCIKAQHYQLCFEVVYSYFILQVPSLLKRDVLLFQAHWLLPGWVAESRKISDAKFPVLSVWLSSTFSGFSNLLILLGNKFGQRPSLCDFIRACLFVFFPPLLE